MLHKMNDFWKSILTLGCVVALFCLLSESAYAIQLTGESFVDDMPVVTSITKTIAEFIIRYFRPLAALILFIIAAFLCSRNMWFAGFSTVIAALLILFSVIFVKSVDPGKDEDLFGKVTISKGVLDV